MSRKQRVVIDERKVRYLLDPERPGNENFSFSVLELLRFQLGIKCLTKVEKRLARQKYEPCCSELKDFQSASRQLNKLLKTLAGEKKIVYRPSRAHSDYVFAWGAKKENEEKDKEAQAKFYNALFEKCNLTKSRCYSGAARMPISDLKKILPWLILAGEALSANGELE